MSGRSRDPIFPQLERLSIRGRPRHEDHHARPGRWLVPVDKMIASQDEAPIIPDEEDE